MLFRRKFVLIYTAWTDGECMDIKGKLTTAGIFHKTKIRGSFASNSPGFGLGQKQTQYDIYVRVEDEYKAREALRK